MLMYFFVNQAHQHVWTVKYKRESGQAKTALSIVYIEFLKD